MFFYIYILIIDRIVSTELVQFILLHVLKRVLHLLKVSTKTFRVSASRLPFLACSSFFSDWTVVNGADHKGATNAAEHRNASRNSGTANLTSSMMTAFDYDANGWQYGNMGI